MFMETIMHFYDIPQIEKIERDIGRILIEFYLNISFFSHIVDTACCYVWNIELVIILLE